MNFAGVGKNRKGEANMVSRADTLPDYLTTEEVAGILGYNVKHVRRMIRKKKLKADKKSGVWLVSCSHQTAQIISVILRLTEH